MATSDVHMHLLPDDRAAPASPVAASLAGAASLIRIARAEAENSILLDNGDFLHGSPMGDSVAEGHQQGRQAPRGGHPIVAAMRSLGYDAVTLGNHDFDQGVEYLGQVLRGAPFVVVASNLTLKTRPTAKIARPLAFTLPFAFLERKVTDRAGQAHALKVGLLGMLPPNSISGLHDSDLTVEIRDIVQTARLAVPQLRALGADVVIVLAHSGIGKTAHRPDMENAVVPLAAVPGIDAIIAGHAHQVFPSNTGTWAEPVDHEAGRIHGTATVAPGFWGSHLGVIDLTLERAADSTWRMAASRSEVRPASSQPGHGHPSAAQIAPDRRIVRMLGPLKDRLDSEGRRVIGTTRRRLHTYFALAAPSPAVDLIHRAMLRFAETALDPAVIGDAPLLASSAPFRTGGFAGPHDFTDIPAGPITARALADLYCYPNALYALKLTGAELADWLERAASVFNTVRPGAAAAPLVEPGCPGYTFESVAGCCYEIDLSRPGRYHPSGMPRDRTASRIRNLLIGGRPLAPDRAVILLTNSFRITGGGHYPRPDNTERVIDLSIGMREMLSGYLCSNAPYDYREPLARWRFARLPGASVTLLTAPQAREIAADSLDARATLGGVTDGGFQEIHLAL